MEKAGGAHDGWDKNAPTHHAHPLGQSRFVASLFPGESQEYPRGRFAQRPGRAARGLPTQGLIYAKSSDRIAVDFPA